MQQPNWARTNRAADRNTTSKDNTTMPIDLMQIMDEYEGEQVTFELSGEDAVEQGTCHRCDTDPVHLLRVVDIHPSGETEERLACLRCGALL